MPLATTAAARAAACVRDEANTLLPVLLDAHRRSYDHWMREDYGGYTDQHSELAARVLVDLALEGDTSPLVQALLEYVGNNHALYQLLRDVTVLFTYEEDLREQLGRLWPLLMSTVLDAVDSGANLYADPHWADYLLGALLPAPEARMQDKDIDATLARARAAWVEPGAIAELVERWLVLAVGEPKAADAVVQFARTRPVLWQATTGLTWLEQIIGTRFQQVANQCWFVSSWLEGLRATSDLHGDGLARWHRVVDGLAAAFDIGAAALQRIDE
jgi:hypothetical protein